MNPPLTSTSRFLAVNASPEELRRAIAEQALWIERQNKTNEAFQTRVGKLEEDFADWRNDQRQANELILTKLAAIEANLAEIRTARSLASTFVKAAFGVASLVIAAKAAGLF